MAVWAMRRRLPGVVGRVGAGGDASSACIAVRACVDCMARGAGRAGGGRDAMAAALGVVWELRGWGCGTGR